MRQGNMNWSRTRSLNGLSRSMTGTRWPRPAIAFAKAAPPAPPRTIAMPPVAIDVSPPRSGHSGLPCDGHGNTGFGWRPKEIEGLAGSGAEFRVAFEAERFRKIGTVLGDGASAALKVIQT
jgi:hypothetical protein